MIEFITKFLLIICLFKGKFKARFELLTENEAEEFPAGLGRNDPNGLDMPKYFKIWFRE